MTSQEKKQLQITACKVRMGIIEGTHAAKCGHPGGSMSAAEMFTYLYNKELNVDPANPKWEDRDRFVLSKGHTAPGLYAALAHKGFFPVEDLLTLRKIDSYLQGHPNMAMVPGVDMSTGSLGQGISVAVGMALGLRLQGKTSRVYTLLGDGELQEGLIWDKFFDNVSAEEFAEVAGAETAPIENLSDAVVAAAAAHSGKVTEGYTVTVGGEAAGYAFKVVAGGSQGDIEMIVGVDADNAVTGVSVVNHKETSGIGTKVMGDEPTTSGTGALTQFIGKSGAGSLVVKSNIDAVSGATVSTKGVTKGVNAALACAATLG